ncbi:MAG: TetR/AcrR family transcriptional regulator [Streptomycetaceae bacterium]|nr:TetR/AcrR family transcriptional regulator [Streptomycetaceae bacterium]
MAGGDRLDRAAVISAAARLADEEGVARLTLSRLARALDRHVASLYTHVDGIDGLYRQVALLTQREIGDRLWQAAMGRSGAEAIMALAEAYREYVLRHPGRYEVLVRYHHPADDDQFRANAQYVAEPIRASLRSFGLGPAEVSSALQVFSASIRGLCLNEAVGWHADKKGPEQALRQFVALFTTGLTSGAWPVPQT